MCQHIHRGFYKHVCSNGALQVRELCKDCGANVRGVGINVSHAELFNIANMIARELPPDTEAGPGLPLFDGVDP